MCTSVVPDLPRSCPVPAGLPTIDPEELHRYLLKCHRLENRVRYRFIQGLYAIEVGQLYLQLGAESTQEYADEHFGWKATRVYDGLKIVERLEHLPLTKEAYLTDLAYTRVKEICRVASAETEAEWIDFARKNSIKKLELEVKNAKETNRKRPRKGTFGLPGVKMRLPFTLSPEEYALIEKALKKHAKEIAQLLPDPTDEIGLKEVLLLLAKRILETDPQSRMEGRVEREDSIFTILYHRCPDCHRSHIATEDGPVEVSPEAVEQVEGRAHKVEIKPEEEVPPAEAPAPAPDAPRPAIDRPNPRSLLRRLYLRDGRVCANPRCRRKDHLQGHHLEARRNGGRTEIWNEVLLCPMCHSLVELGILEITGSPLTGLEFRTRGAKIAADFRAEMKEVAEIPLVVAVRSSGAAGSRIGRNGRRGSHRSCPGSGARFSGYPENGGDPGDGTDGPGFVPSNRPGPDEVEAFDISVRGLEKLEFPRREALSLALKALERLRERAERPTAEALVKEAFRIRA